MALDNEVLALSGASPSQATYAFDVVSEEKLDVKKWHELVAYVVRKKTCHILLEIVWNCGSLQPSVVSSSDVTVADMVSLVSESKNNCTKVMTYCSFVSGTGRII